MQQFQKGERLVSMTNNASSFPKGTIAIFVRYSSAYTGNPEDCIKVYREGDSNCYESDLYAYKFELAPKINVKTQQQEELYVVFNMECNNYIGMAKSFAEALTKANPLSAETLTIYKLLPIARAIRKKVVEKIKSATNKASSK